MRDALRGASFRVKTAVGLTGFVLLYALIALATHLFVRSMLIPTSRGASADLERLEPKIIADFKRLAEKPIFKTLPREKNAEHFISGFISWSGANTHPLKNPEHDLLMSLKSRFEKAAQSDDAWKAFLADESLAKLELAWVDQLTAYDHIDFGTHRAQERMLDQVEKLNSLQRIDIATRLPLPEMAELRFAALARVAQLQNENRLDEAPTLYRHIAYLFHSTDSLIGSLMAVSMLQTEVLLAARTQHEWPLIENDSIDAMKRAAWAWIGIERLRASKPDLGAFEPYLKRSTGACSGSFEMIGYAGLLQGLQDYFVPTAPLEYDLRERIARIDHFQRRLLDLCDHERLKVFLNPVSPDANPLFTGLLRPNWARFPFIRRIIGLKLLAQMVPNYFHLYETHPREPASSSSKR